MKQSEEIGDIINELNTTLFELGITVEGECEFEYSWNGYREQITFLGCTIWNSDSDNRVWIEKTNDYEPLKPFLIGEAKWLISKLTKFLGYEDQENNDGMKVIDLTPKMKHIHNQSYTFMGPFTH